MMSPAIPEIETALHILSEAERRNPGPWADHSRFTAQAAQLISAHCSNMDPAESYTLGLLHDIGRRDGSKDMRHVLDGYRYLSSLGYDTAARICLTHSYPIQNAEAGSGQWDGTIQEYQFVEKFLKEIEYTLYDRLIQLCDALAMPGGFCLIEKRLLDVALRRGINPLTIKKWKAYLALQKEFEAMVGTSIYALLPGVIETTFGFNPGTS